MKFRSAALLVVFFLFAGFIPAQISDNFSDGDFTANPTWSGDAADYQVNASFQLQLNSASTVADTSYLSFPSPFIGNAEWDFWVKESFAPSDNNNVRVYLVSDIANLKGNVNGYYVRMGENGSLDSIDLWEQSGTTQTKIIDGINNHCAATTNTLRIKVTRDATGTWTLYSDTTGGTNYQVEGMVFDNTHTTSSFFGVFSKYTISNVTKFYYDDIYVGPVIVDNTPPTLVSATATSATALDVLFDENVDAVTSQVTTNYSVNNSIGNPITAVRDAVNHSLVHLTFSSSFVSATAYTLTVTNVQDLSANAITSANTNFTYFPLSNPVFHDVIINEIMADPSPVVALPNTEFVELYNRSANNFDLSGWGFTDGVSNGALNSAVIPAGGYVIICANADTSLLSPYGPTVGVSSWPSLNNSGDNLKLMDAASNVIDSVDYDISWYQDAIKQNGGWTLELINPNAGIGCSPAGNWIASVNVAGGTPGTQNSVYNNSPDIIGPILQSVSATDSLHVVLCFNEAIDPSQLTTLSNYNISPAIGNPISLYYDTTTLRCIYLTLGTALSNNTTYTITFGALTDCAGNAANPNSGIFSYHKIQPYDVVINEIMADPDPPVQLPNEEYFELFNRTPYSLSLDNWTITVGTTTRTLVGVTLPADSFVVLTSTTAAPLFTGINVVGVTSFSALTNTGATITLRDVSGMEIHSVTYSDTWYQNSAKQNGGWSLEQIDPNNPCGGMNNWKASVATAGGTPGARNSVNASNPDHVAPRLVRVSVLAADSLRLFFSEPLDSLTMANVSRYTIDNSIGNPLSVRPVSPDFTKCDLKLPVSIVAGIIYHVSVNTSLSDCAGNALETPNDAPFALPEAALRNDIVINEILFDPNAGGTDFVEIYNRSGKVVDLKNIVLCTADTVAHILNDLNVVAPEGYLFFPSQYLVLSQGSVLVQQQYPSETNIDLCLDMTNIPSMNVSGGIVILADTGFHIIDSLVYSSSWHFPLLQTTKGVSLERIDFDRQTQDPTNWHSASENIGFATPTQQNSQYSPMGTADDGAVTVSAETSQQIFSPDGDGYNDVININYLFSEPGYVANVSVYDARGRLVRTLVRNELLGTMNGSFSWDGTMDDRTKARVGAYVIYFEAFKQDGTVKEYKRSCVLAGKL
ncbi:MAG: lamin tail domain-containing protein [Bacteroidetes bacterium]|nr:lamin tail domain-containing protein [Bacteroidota bacterium]